MKQARGIEIAIYAAACVGTAVCAWKGILFLPAFCLGIVALKLLADAAGARAIAVRAIFVLVVLYAAFKFFVSMGILGVKGLESLGRGFAFVPFWGAAAVAVSIIIVAAPALRGGFRSRRLIDAAVLLIFASTTLEVAFQQMPFFAGVVAEDPAIVFERRDRGFHYGVALAPGGGELFYTTRAATNTVTRCDIARDKCSDTALPAENPLRIGIDPEHGRLFVNYDGSHRSDPDDPALAAFSIIDLNRPEAGEHALTFREAGFTDFIVEPGGETFAAIHKHGLARRIRASDGAAVVDCELSFQPYFIARHPGTGAYYVTSTDGLAVGLDPETMCEKWRLKLGPAAGAPVVDPVRNRLYVASIVPGDIRVIDLETRRVTGSINSFYFTRELAYLPGRDRLLAGDYRTGRVAVIDPATGKTIKIFRFGKMLRKLETDPDSARAAAVSYLGAFVFSVP